MSNFGVANGTKKKPYLVPIEEEKRQQPLNSCTLPAFFTSYQLGASFLKAKCLLFSVIFRNFATKYFFPIEVKKHANPTVCSDRCKTFARTLQDFAPPAARYCHGRGKLVTPYLRPCSLGGFPLLDAVPLMLCRRLFKTTPLFHQNISVGKAKQRRCFKSSTSEAFFVPSRGNTCRLLVVTSAGSGMVQL